MDADFPTKTAESFLVQSNTRAAKQIDLPTGNPVWMQTLNSFHRSEADREANYSAAIAVRRFKKNKELFEAYTENFDDMDKEGQVAFLVEHEMLTGRIPMEAEMKYPIPMRPEKEGDESEESYVSRVDKYQDQLEQCFTNRAKHIDDTRAKKSKEIEALTLKVRSKKCMDAFMEGVFAKAFNTAQTHEVILRAVRTCENHLQQHYRNIQVVEDLDDDLKEFLIETYRNLDFIHPDEIPTSPVESSD